MLKVHTLRSGRHAYYLEDLVPGRAEGTLLGGEAPGTWWGHAAADLHLTGRIGSGDFSRLLAGRHPLSGRPLRRDAHGRGTAGFDLTFCAPKSVSILHLLAPAEMAAEVGEGHRAAVADAMGYVEREAVGVRRSSRGEVVRLAATGVASGTFVHRTSRVLDPHLHTHVVVANVAQGIDGAWSALDSRRLFRHAPAVQAVYHARLRFELTERLGVAWEVAPSGLADVVGVDPALRHLFSGRSADVDEHVHWLSRPPASPDSVTSPAPAGRRGPVARRMAALLTRPPKDHSRTVEDLVPRWRARAQELGYPPSELTRVVGLGRSPTRSPGPDGWSSRGSSNPVAAGVAPDPTRLIGRLAELGRDGRSLARRELIAEVATACPAGAPSGAVEAIVSRLAPSPSPAVPVAVHGGTRVGPERRWPARDLAEAAESLSIVLGEGGRRGRAMPPVAERSRSQVSGLDRWPEGEPAGTGRTIGTAARHSHVDRVPASRPGSPAAEAAAEARRSTAHRAVGRETERRGLTP